MTSDPDIKAAGRALAFPYLIYQILAHLLAPLMLAIFWRRGRREPAYRARTGERFGALPVWDRSQSPILIFAASLGETRAVAPLVRVLLERGYKVQLCHSSPAGLSEGQKQFYDALADGRVKQAYIPIDLFWCLRRGFKRCNPTAILIVESEIWPGIALEALRKSIPVVQVNGAINDHTMSRSHSWIGRTRLKILQTYAQVQTKSERHVARYREAGVRDDRIRLVGELRFDMPINTDQIASAQRLRANPSQARPALLIASSVEDEEPALLKIVQDLLTNTPKPRIIWAPRSPQRFDAVAEALVGPSTARRSEVFDEALEGNLPETCDILIGDSIGEMAFYYELSDLVFVGASLNGHGGHNIVEPLSQGRPVVMGPSIWGIDFPAQEALAEGCFESLADAEAVNKRLQHLLSHPDDLKKMGKRSKDFHERNSGTAIRAIEALKFHLPD